MKYAILAIVAIVVLGGGAAFAYLYFQPAQTSETEEGAEADSGEHGDTHAKADKKKEKAHADSSAHAEPAQFVELDPIILPVLDKDGVSQTVSLVVSLEVFDHKAVEEVTHNKPKLVDAIIQELYGAFDKKDVMDGGVLKVGPIKERLLGICDKIMGEGIVSDVLLQVVQQRPL